MNTRPQVSSQDAAGTFRWSVRILALGLAGIFFLTLYPFRFAIPRSSASPGWPFLLGGFEKTFSPFAIFLNVLLFIPFGFGLAGQIKKRGGGPLETAFLTFAAGALLSY